MSRTDDSDCDRNPAANYLEQSTPSIECRAEGDSRRLFQRRIEHDSDGMATKRNGSERENSNVTSRERRSFVFTKDMRNSMKPSLTTQFMMQWSWRTSIPNNSRESTDAPECGEFALGPVTVTQLRGDPCIRKGERLVAVVITEGHRFLLPLMPEDRASELAKSLGVFWSVPTKPYLKKLRRFPLSCLVIGTYKQLEDVSVAIESAFTPSMPNINRPDEPGSVPSASTTTGSTSPVAAFSFKTMPYRVLWLCQLQDCLVVSLPCEEKLIIISVTPCNQCTLIAPNLSSNTLQCTNTFSFPPHVVPLDITELYDRPFIAVGTVCHGIFVLLVEEGGGCLSIAHHISLSGLSTSFFPVTRLASHFLRLPSAGPIDESRGSCEQRAFTLLQCLNGLLLCSSLYDYRTIVVKCGSGFSDGGGYELPSERWFFSSFISSHVAEPDVGTLLGTPDGRLVRLIGHQASDPKVTELEVKVPDKSTGKCLGIYNATAPIFSCDSLFRCAPTEIPSVLCEGGPVYQITNTGYETSFIRHWVCLATSENEVLLLNRNIQSYAKHSSIKIKSPRGEDPVGEEMSQAAHVVGAEMKNVDKPVEGKPLNDVTENNDQFPTTGLNTQVSESSIIGLSWLLVDNGFLQVVVAHHTNWLSVVTWKQ
uniref:Uncharacterized protein n=1 Tax=Trypanosoma congolense (strain IL3000) TaxID=1068625 RepID=G0UR17_TRYCI|nr:conserved hypothetical protein [Trypanosoma congolense IL3000]